MFWLDDELTCEHSTTDLWYTSMPSNHRIVLLRKPEKARLLALVYLAIVEIVLSWKWRDENLSNRLLTFLSPTQEVFTEMEEKYGEVEEMNVCDNLGDHLVGNVYVKVGVGEKHQGARSKTFHITSV